MTDRELEDLFAAARSAPLAVPEALTARVLADAEAEAAAVAGRGAAVAVTAKPGLWARLGAVFARAAMVEGMGALGGAGASAGMVAATLAGFYIGFAEPVDMGPLASALGLSVQEIDMMPGLEALLEEAP